MTEIIKPCVKCGATERYATGDCKACATARRAAYYKANREKLTAANTAWAKANPEKLKAIKDKWVKANPTRNFDKYWADPEKYKARTIAWTKANPEKKKVAGVAYRAANVDKEIAKRAARYEANPAKAKASVAAWRKENPEGHRTQTNTRRARKLAVGGTFTRADIKKLMTLQKSKCVACNVDISKRYHIDHVMPLALGGSNFVTNLQLLCPPCNLKKCAKHPVDFMQERGFLL